jgi:exopolyphosphatase/guanosine-5'-triphosphate,3'-diphosphate pyrophosphatase
LRGRAVATQLFEALQPLHGLAPPYGRLLEAAAYLHDVGHFIADSSHHKHSYYVVSNSDMPGFTPRERELIANLCRYHRKAPPLQEHANLRALTEELASSEDLGLEKWAALRVSDLFQQVYGYGLTVRTKRAAK